ncbi:antitoxin [Bacteroidia bacterium]|nr:antitoxin [Bacteroidia bacterium]
MQNNKPFDINICLKDIERSISEIWGFLPEQRDFFEFQKDLKARKAVERNIEIIGEAMSRILKTNPDFPIEASRKIVDTRNRIIHGYDSVSEDVLWLIIINYLPNLERQVKGLLSST